MAIRTNTNPMRPDLQLEMRALLMRNGMQAHVVPVGDSYQLVVQGHDSPLLQYPISRQQMQALTDWGTNYANKKAYETFTDIVKDDFDMPRNFVHARNANGRVAMGLHGYRIGIGEYGRVGRYGMPPPFLGWTPRQQEGYHLRRVGGRLFYAGTPMVAERLDGRMKPGEMQSGGYGFYYKGHRQPQEQAQPVRQDVLQDLQAVITPMVNKPRSEEPAKPYKEQITSPVYFSNEKWQEQDLLLPLESDNSLAPHSAEQTVLQEDEHIIREPQEGALIDGRDLSYINENKGWYREGEHGREVEVEAIAVQPAETEGKYKMTAIINGESITHEISQKQYDKFLAVDDYHRMKLFSKIFNEVDMKTRPEMSSGLGTKIFAALAAGAVVLSDVAHELHHPCLEFYGERFSSAPRPYFKPGVDSPMDVAARNFEAQMNKEVAEMHRGF